MLVLVHLSLWPWKRTTARSDVAASTGGIDERWPCAMSTHTNGNSCSVRKSSVSAWLSSANQDAWRNSTATRSGRHRAATSSRYCLFARRMVNQGGNWNRITPSLPASTNGSRADRNRLHTSSYACAGRSFGYRFLAASSGRRSFGSADGLVGWPVSRLNALMLNVNPGGVRWAHSAVVRSFGGA